MFCPKCGSEFREGYYKCSDCDILLVNELPKDFVNQVNKHGAVINILLKSLLHIKNYTQIRYDGQIDYSLRIKHSGKMLLPVICTSILFLLCYKIVLEYDRISDDIYLVANSLYLITSIYNAIFLPIYLAYYNILKFNYVNKRIINFWVIILITFMGNFIQFIYIYKIGIRGFFPKIPQGREDWSLLFFLYPTTLSFIVSIISYIMFEVIACIIKAMKR